MTKDCSFLKTCAGAPTLGRRMLALERRLGREIFERLPRGYALTAEGEALLARASEVERQLNLIQQHLREFDRIALYSRDTIEVLLPETSRREAVIGVRNRRPEEPGLAGRRVAEVRFAVYAREAGVATWARVMGATPSAAWVREASRGAPAIEVTSPRNALDLALAGAARAVLPVFVGRESGLEQVTDEIGGLTHDQWLVSHHEARFEPEVRAVLDRIGAVLARAA